MSKPDPGKTEPRAPLASLEGMLETTEAEEAYRQWCEGLRSRELRPPDADMRDYGPALQYGAQARQRFGPGAAWDDAEPMLATHWKRSRSGSTLSWEEARPAVRAAWQGDVPQA